MQQELIPSACCVGIAFLSVKNERGGDAALVLKDVLDWLAGTSRHHAKGGGFGLRLKAGLIGAEGR
jgi:hypothetical protein